MTSTRWAEQQPEVGDVVLHCGHGEPCVWWRYGTRMIFRRPDGTSGAARWLVACDACDVRAGGDPRKIEVHGDGTWTGDSPVVKDDRNG